MAKKITKIDTKFTSKKENKNNNNNNLEDNKTINDELDTELDHSKIPSVSTKTDIKHKKKDYSKTVDLKKVKDKIVNKNKKKNDKKEEEPKQIKVVEKKKLLTDTEINILKEKLDIKNKALVFTSHVKRKVKIKRGKKLLLIAFILCIFLVIGLSIYLALFLINKNKEEMKILKQNEIAKEIGSHYGKFVKIVNESKIYSDVAMKEEIGTIFGDYKVELKEEEIYYTKKAFFIPEFNGYISYKDVSPIEKIENNFDQRYKNYGYFNLNLKTKSGFTLYDSDGTNLFKLNTSMDFPIIVNNDEGKYYVNYNDRFSYILSDDVETVYNQNNGAIGIPNMVTTLCYHTVKDSCSEIYTCRQKDRFNADLEAIKNAGYFTLTLQEMYWYMYEMVNIPAKSVLLTFDDGGELPNIVDSLKKYDMHGNSFLITSWFANLDQIKDSHLSFGSHTHNMHNPWECGGGLSKIGSSSQGGGILCKPRDYILDDLKKSRAVVENSNAFCYPFYDFNDYSEGLLKEAGFKIAFIGAYGGYRYSHDDSPYRIRRMTIWDTTSTNEVLNYVTGRAW